MVHAIASRQVWINQVGKANKTLRHFPEDRQQRGQKLANLQQEQYDYAVLRSASAYCPSRSRCVTRTSASARSNPPSRRGTRTSSCAARVHLTHASFSHRAAAHHLNRSAAARCCRPKTEHQKDHAGQRNHAGPRPGEGGCGRARRGRLVIMRQKDLERHWKGFSVWQLLACL